MRASDCSAHLPRFGCGTEFRLLQYDPIRRRFAKRRLFLHPTRSRRYLDAVLDGGRLLSSTVKTTLPAMLSVSMTIKSASALRSPFSGRRFALLGRSVALLASLLLVFATDFCFGQGNAPIQPPAPQPAPAAAAPAATGSQSGGVSAPAGYVLSANDQISVEVFGEDDLRTNGRLNGEGNLSVPLLGSVRLSGLTLTQAAARLTELYGKGTRESESECNSRGICEAAIHSPGSGESPG